MKKTVFTTVAVAALVFGLGTSSAFANGKFFSDKNRQNCCPQNGRMPEQMEMPNGMGMRHGGMGMARADLFGTVSAVSADKKTLTVKDADGKETQVHVNPFTMLVSLPSAEERKAAFENRKDGERGKMGERKLPFENTLTLADVKVGDWVMVSRLGGETKTLEAGRICVAKE